MALYTFKNKIKKMKIVKLYEEFWGKKAENEDLEFDFLVAVGRCKQAINKVVEVHENHYYGDTKIVNDTDFQNSLKSYIDLMLNEKGGLDEILEIVRESETKLYNDNKFGIDSDDDYSMLGILEDLTGSLWSAVKNKNERQINYLNKTSKDILDKCDDSWVYREDMETSMKKASDTLDSMDIDSLDSDDSEYDDDSDVFSRWETSEGLQEDLEKFIGKPLGDFEYGDKLRAFKYVSENETIQYILEEGNTQEVTQVKNFLNNLKQFFEL